MNKFKSDDFIGLFPDDGDKYLRDKIALRTNYLLASTINNDLYDNLHKYKFALENIKFSIMEYSIGDIKTPKELFVTIQKYINTLGE